MDGFIQASDLHLTSKPQDEYRWDCFRFIADRAEQFDAEEILVSGDLGDGKDKHPAVFVDRLVGEITKLADRWRFSIVMGNHDYMDANTPFFRFLSNMPNVRFFDKPGPATVAGMRCLMIPHARDWHPNTEWRRNTPFIPEGQPYDYLIAHQTFKGAIASNGDRMDGPALSIVSKERTAGAPVLSGDIHVPQRVGNVTYVGSPHPVCFGDDFEPRILFVQKDGIESIPNCAAMGKHMVKLEVHGGEMGVWDTQRIFEGDQVKVQLKIDRASLLDLSVFQDRIKRKLDEIRAVHFGTDVQVVDNTSSRRRLSDLGKDDVSSPEKVFEAFCKHKKVPAAFKAAARKYL